MSGGTTPAAASTTVPKVSMFGAKSGFVIPKNKLSGSLVPILRGSNKQKDSGKASEESTTQVQRKTKWGPDLTQDADVRKGRALAYQTRVDQIIQQLKSGNLVVEDNQEPLSKAQHLNDTSISDQIECENPELLELERREIIGEILKLNPSYKAPPDYKPLLKETRVPIPVNQYPGYNFVNLIYGPGSDTKTRLEKETGSKLQLYGTKRNTGEKVEITPSNGNEIVVAYEELHVHVSAETFEKVDAAVALIEMLLNSVSGNLVPVATSTSVSGDNVHALTQSQGAHLNMAPTTAANQGMLHNPVVDPTQENQFRYPSPWFPNGPLQTSMYPSSGFIPPSSSAAPYPNNPSNLPSVFGARPTSSTGFNSIPQNPSLLPLRPNQPSQGMQHQYTPQTHPLGPPVPAQYSSAPPTILAQPQFAGSQAPPAGPHLSGRPFMPPHPGSNGLPGPPPSGSSVRWSGSSAVPLGPPPANISTGNMAQPAFYPSRPQLQSTSVNHPPSLGFGSGPAPPPASTLGSGQYPSPMPSAAHGPPMQSGMPGSISGSASNFTPLRPPQMPLPRSQLPGSGDFTFQPNQSQNSASQTFPRLSNHHIHNIPPSNPIVQPSAPQAPPFQFTVHNHSSSQSGTQMYSRPQISNQIGQPQGPRSAVPFSGNPNPPRLPAFPNAGPALPRNPIPQMGPRHYSHQMPNLPGSFPPRPVQNFPVRPGNYMPPNQQFSSRHPFASDNPASSRPRGMQNYDPFLPTAGSIVPQQQAGRKQENDVEYEDLMASVGVK